MIKSQKRPINFNNSNHFINEMHMRGMYNYYYIKSRKIKRRKKDEFCKFWS